VGDFVRRVKTAQLFRNNEPRFIPPQIAAIGNLALTTPGVW
jgi:hypothetical protein